MRALLALSCCIAAAAPAQTRLSWNADVTVTARARNVTPLDLSEVVAHDGELTPRGALVLTRPNVSLGLMYQPTFRVREPFLSPRFDYTQRGQLDASWQADPQWRLAANASLTQGLLDLSTIQRTTGTAVPFDPVRQVGLVHELTVDASANVQHQATHDFGWLAEVGYTWGGGSDAPSRVALPLQRSPRGLLRGLWVLDREDTLLVQLDGRYSTFSTGARLFSIEGLAGWRRLLGPQTNLELTAGAAAVTGARPPPVLMNLPPGGDPNVVLGPVAPLSRPTFLPAGGAALNHRLEWREATSLDLGASVHVAPFADRFIAAVYPRAEVALNAVLTVQRDLQTYARGGVTRAWGEGSGDLSTTYVEAGAGYEGARWWRVDLSARHATLFLVPLPDGMPQAPQVQWLVSLGFTLRSEGVFGS